MIQTYNNILQEIQSFKSDIKDIGHIQKIYSSSCYICIQIRFPGASKYLALGRGHGYEGLWNSTIQVPSELRKRDRFLEYLRKYLSSSIFLDVGLDSDDRIIRIEYGRYGKKNNLYLFYCGRELFFANEYYNEKTQIHEIFKSWSKFSEVSSHLGYKLFDEVGRKDIEDKQLKNTVIGFSKLIAQEKKKNEDLNFDGKSLKFLKRKEKNIQNDLLKMNDIKLIEDLLKQENLDEMPIKNKIGALKMNFKTKDHFKRRDEVFQKIKKIKKSQEMLKIRLNDTISNLKRSDLDNKIVNKLETIQPYWKAVKTETGKTINVSKEYKTIEVQGLNIAFGMNSNGNDQIRNSWAKKEDYWFHLDNETSTHIIVKMGSNNLDNRVLEVVAQMFKKIMKLPTDEVSLLYTQVKNLKSVKGSPGKVLYKKEKRIKIYVSEIDSIINDSF